MNESKNLPAITTGTGVALKNVSKSLKITSKLLGEIQIISAEDWQWWNSLRPYYQYSLYCNSANEILDGNYSWKYNGRGMEVNAQELEKILKLEKLKILFSPKAEVDSSFLEKLVHLKQLHIGYDYHARVSYIKHDYLKPKYTDPFYNFYDCGVDILTKDYHICDDNWGVFDYSRIKILENLEYIYLNDYNLTSIEFLKDLTSLKGIVINGNVKENNLDFTAFKRLNILTLSGVILTSNTIKKLTESKNLIILNLMDNHLFDINLNFPLLERLNLNCNQIKELSFQYNLPYLKYIIAESNFISSLNGFKFIENVQVLKLSKNKLSDCTEIAFLKALESLILDNNNLKNIDFLISLENLKYLDLSSNQLLEISNLSKLVNLKELHLSNNNIEDISNLSELKYLEILFLGGNKISNITCLAKIKTLETLVLDYNPIEEAEVEWLEKQLPNCRFIQFHKYKHSPKIGNPFLDNDVPF